MSVVVLANYFLFRFTFWGGLQFKMAYITASNQSYILTSSIKSTTLNAILQCKVTNVERAKPNR